MDPIRGVAWVSFAMVIACGGVTTEVQGDASADASTEASTACPNAAELSAAIGTSCANEGLSCGGSACTNPCTFCNIVRCTGGVWTQNEAFPDPSCNDAQACSYPPVQNDPSCPASYSYSSGGHACSPIGLSCAYPGAGDGLENGCYATAMMWCNGDGGSGTWTVAQ